jgi:hypothetical protein
MSNFITKIQIDKHPPPLHMSRQVTGIQLLMSKSFSNMQPRFSNSISDIQTLFVWTLTLSEVWRIWCRGSMLPVQTDLLGRDAGGFVAVGPDFDEPEGGSQFWAALSVERGMWGREMESGWCI